MRFSEDSSLAFYELLSGRPKNMSGNCAVCTLEGTRPLIAEIQALVTPTAFPAPRRTTNGIDYNRMCLLIAVLEKRMNLRFYENDVYVNVAGGVSLDEPSADLSIAMALISGITDKVIPDPFDEFKRHCKRMIKSSTGATY